MPKIKIEDATVDLKVSWLSEPLKTMFNLFNAWKHDRHGKVYTGGHSTFS